MAQQQGRVAEYGEAAGQQDAAVNVIDQKSHHDHGEQGADAARTDGEAAIQSRIAQQRLQKQGQHGDDAIKSEAVEAGDQGSHAEVAVSQNAQLHNGLAAPELADDKAQQGDG